MRVPLSISAELLASFFEDRLTTAKPEQTLKLLAEVGVDEINRQLDLHRPRCYRGLHAAQDSCSSIVAQESEPVIQEIYKAVKDLIQEPKRAMFFDTLFANIFGLARRTRFKADFGIEFQELMAPHLDKLIKLGRTVSNQVKEIDTTSRKISKDYLDGYESKSELDRLDQTVSTILTQSNEQLAKYRVIASDNFRRDPHEIQVGLAMFQSSRGLELFRKIQTALENAGFKSTYANTDTLTLAYTVTPPRNPGGGEELALAA